MKRLGKRLCLTLLGFSLVGFACVTINIYFPAEKVESVAGEIVDEIRSRQIRQKEEPARDKESRGLRESLFALTCPQVWADDVTTVSNPTIRSLKQSMKQRYNLMKSYYKKGLLNEGNDGFVSLKRTQGLGLRDKRDLKNLIAAENKDRKRLYQEIAKALNIDPSQTGRIADIFAREWQKPVR